MKAIMVAFRSTFDEGLGGVQICTREYVEVLKIAGFQINECLFDSDMRLTTRIKRKFWPSLYSNVIPRGLINRVVSMVRDTGAEYLFLNQVTVAQIAKDLKNRLPHECKIVVLSHGLESTDMLHSIRVKDQLPIAWHGSFSPELLLGKTISSEAKFRRYVDLTISVSPFDELLERWLGVKRSIWIPRVIDAVPITWKPEKYIFGFVGTLSHPPNLEGLVQALEAMKARDPKMRVRIVGGPVDIGKWVQSNYENADYLGKLNNQELEIEASKWRAFLHPIFCIPRGCSTKLATGINWQIPIITTESGARGYKHDKGEFCLSETPEEFAILCSELLDDEKMCDARQGIVEISETSPATSSIAISVKEAIDSI
ncbi:glycosyltransferase [Pseudomonadota bacterium]